MRLYCACVCVCFCRLSTYCKFQMSEHSLRNVHFKHCSIGIKNKTGIKRFLITEVQWVCCVVSEPDIHMHVYNAVPLVWDWLRLKSITKQTKKQQEKKQWKDGMPKCTQTRDVKKVKVNIHSYIPTSLLNCEKDVVMDDKPVYIYLHLCNIPSLFVCTFWHAYPTSLLIFPLLYMIMLMVLTNI